MNDKKQVKQTVEQIVTDLKANPSRRFSKSDFQLLVYGVLSDEDFKLKKYLLRNDQLQEDDSSLNQGMKKFLDKLLKHAGMNDIGERTHIIDTFEYAPKDLEWVSDAVDEAMFIYSEADKNVRIFRDKMLQMTIRKMKRTGKTGAGKVTYKKSVVDRAAALAKRTANK